MFTIDSKGTILLLNDAAVELFGYEYSELLGEPISLICGGEHAAKHDQYMKNYLQTGVTQIMGKKREVPARKKCGTEFPVELGIKEIKTEDDGIIFAAFIKDLSMQKEQERQLRYRERITQAAVDSSFDPMISINESGIIVSCNKAALNLFGYEREKFLGANISIICGDGHSKHHDEYIQRYLKTGQKKIIGRKRPTKARRADGTEFDIELGVQEVIDEATGERMFCGYVRDCTAQKLQQERMMRHESSIQDNFFGPAKGMHTPISRGKSNGSSTGDKSTGRMPKRLLHHANTTM
jgi:PAS domain S-box-containing protein